MKFVKILLITIFLVGCSLKGTDKIQFIREDGTNDNVKNNILKNVRLSWVSFYTTQQIITATQILKGVIGSQKTGFTIKNLHSNDDAIATVRGTAPNFYLSVKKPSKDFTIDLTLEKKGYYDVKLTNKKIRIHPSRTRVSRINILKFPAYKNNYGTWDSGFFISNTEKRPDLIYKILRSSGAIVFQLRDSDKTNNASNADLPIIHRYSRPFEISSIAKNTFKLYDSDSFSNDYMGEVTFSPYDEDFPTYSIFESTNKKIKIKIYFTYSFL